MIIKRLMYFKGKPLIFVFHQLCCQCPKDHFHFPDHLNSFHSVLSSTITFELQLPMLKLWIRGLDFDHYRTHSPIGEESGSNSEMAWIEKVMLVFGSFRSSRCHNVCTSVFIFLCQVRLRFL